MQQALQRETNPHRHRMMECYRMMWRRKYSSAPAGFTLLPPDLKFAIVRHLIRENEK
jgi:hypothetical protein